MNAENFVTINGRALSFEQGETILDIAKRNHIFIPTLCHLPGTRPTGACRICVVEVEGARTLIAACTMPAAPKMVIHTDTAQVIEARRSVLELLLSSGNHNCSARGQSADRWTNLQQDARAYDQSDELCEVYGSCKLQALAYRYQADSSRLAGRKIDYPMETASRLILRDFSRCIVCGRCVQACNESQVNNAISYGFRGQRAKIIGMGDQPLERSECVYCGECLQVCPVGALVERKSRYQIRPWEARFVRTTCGYCGVGCQLLLHVKDNRVMKVSGIEGAQPNQGRLCVKGRFGFDYLASPQRLTKPMIRQGGELREATWDEALDAVAAEMRAVKEAHGAEAIAGVLSDKASNEALYLGQKLFRQAIGTHNVATPFATTGMSNSIAELESAPSILLIGCDVTGESPVAGAAIKRAVRAGAQLIVIDDEPTRISRFATLFLKPRTGTEPVLLNGLIAHLLETGPGLGFDEARAQAEEYPLERVSKNTGLAPETLRQAVAMLQKSPRTMLVYGPKVAAWATLYDVIQEILGNLGAEHGGVNALSELNNSTGSTLMGAAPGFLPGLRRVEDAEARQALEQVWGCTLGDRAGLTFPEMLTGLGAEKDSPVKLLFCAGENLALAAPAIEGAQGALEKAGFLVVAGILEDETTAKADVVLPLAAWAEHEGTFTNAERRVSRARRAVDPPGEARPEIWVYTELARRLGQDWPERASQAVWDEEIAEIVPQVAGIRYDRLAGDGLQWPVTAASENGTPRLDGQRPPRIRPEWQRLNYHHRALLEQCEGLLESLAPDEGGTRDWPTDPREVNRRFMALLEEEEAVDRKPEIDQVLATYRQRRGGLIPVLQQVQGIVGFLPIPVQNYIALGLRLPPADVFGVVSFYSFFTMVPRGKHTIRLCLGTACYVKGSKRILEKLVGHLKIDVGETTGDREFGLEAVRCIGACGLAPVMLIDEDTHGMLDPGEVVGIVEGYRGKDHDA